MLENSTWRPTAYYFLLFSLLILFVPRAGFGGDVDFWIDWSTYSFERGLGNAYRNPGNNYNPLYHWVLWIYGCLMGTPERIKFFAHFLKAFTLLFDFGGAIWAASLVPQHRRRFELSLLLLLNVGYLYNTILWEQVDAIYTFLSFGAVVLAVQRRPSASAALMALALCAKTQAIIFLPPVLLLWLPLWVEKPWSAVRSVVVMSLIMLVVLAPFIWFSWQNDLPRILDINFNATSTDTPVSVNAFNVWTLLRPDLTIQQLMDTPGSQPFGGLTHKQWGQYLFLVFAALTLLPLLVLTARHVLARWQKTAAPAPSMSVVLLSCGLIPVVMTYFNTGMHERYWHAAVLFIGAYSFLTRRYHLLVLVSVAYYLNLEGVMHQIWLKNYGILLLRPPFVAALFGVLILAGLFYLYRAWLRPESDHQQVLGSRPEPVVAEPQLASAAS